MWESGNPAFFAGFPSEVGKSAFGLFHLAAFPQSVAPSFFPLLVITVIFLQRPPSGHFLCYLDRTFHGSTTRAVFRACSRDAACDKTLPPGVIRFGRGRLLFLGRALRLCTLTWNWPCNPLPPHPPPA